MPLFVATDGESDDSDVRFEHVHRYLVTGLTLTVPLIITLIILSFVASFVLGTISPVATGIARAAGFGEIPDVVLELLALAIVVALIFLVGFVGEVTSRKRLEAGLDAAMGHIPGIGSVYTSFSEMSDFLLSNDSQSFREVKLIEFPTQGSYSVAFVTTETPERLEEATGNDDMTTLFMPMAPNPVMGGFVVHVAKDRVYDVDMTVEEGIRSIVTSGVAISPHDDAEAGETVDIKAMREQSEEEHMQAIWTERPDDGNGAEDLHDIDPEDIDPDTTDGSDDAGDGSDADERETGDSGLDR